LHVPSGERAVFLAQVHASVPELRNARVSGFGSPSAFGPSSGFGPTSGFAGGSGFGPATDSLPSGLPGNTPLRPEVVEKAQRLMSTHIGPIAAVVVRRAAATASSREQFFNQLVDQAGAGADRHELLAQLWRLA
jgi:serine/threonine-protein kinase